MSDKLFFSMSSIVQLIRSKIIPWTIPSNFPQRRVIVAHEIMRRSNLPEGVKITTRQLHGERKILRAGRKHGNQRLYTATWPQDNLQETTVPRISCVVQGAADHLHGKYIVHCGPGNFLIFPPGIPHQQFGPFLQGENRENGYCVLVHAYAYSHGVLFWLTTSQGSKHVNQMQNNYLIPNMDAAQLLHLLMNEARENGNEEICKSYLFSFFTLITRDINAGNYLHPGPKEKVNALSSTTSFTDQVREYMEVNCHKILRVDDVARQMYMSNSQFSHRMRKEAGVTFLQLLTQIRIERAKQMLRDTDLTVIAIAGYLSFKSPTHFQALFRKHVGHTPIEYRRKYQNKN